MGAIGDPYASSQALKNYMGLDGTTQYDQRLDDAVMSASQEIETMCNRHFNRQETATPRVFFIDDVGNDNYLYGRLARTYYYGEPCANSIFIDDFWTTDDLVVMGGQGFATTWQSTDYRLLPFNGTNNGVPGWPYETIEPALLGTQMFDTFGIQITAKWGWERVPAPVKQACLIMAAENFQLSDAPFGTAGAAHMIEVSNQLGSPQKFYGNTPTAIAKLGPYNKNRLLVG